MVLFHALSRLCIALPLLLAGVLQGCASLPEGADPPELSITSVTLVNVDGQAAFDIGLDFTHHSATALPLRAMEVNVFVNGIPVADYAEPLVDTAVTPDENHHYSIRVTANRATPVAAASLALNRMVKVNASVMVRAVISRARDEQQFNSSATYEGIIGHVR